jgi:hypothetical protein
MQNEYVAIISALLTAVIGPIAVKIVQNRIDKKNKDTLNEALKENTIVSEKLEKIREKHSADRAWIMQFHNGGNFYPSGKSIQKFSMCYESVDRGINSIQLLLIRFRAYNTEAFTVYCKFFKNFKLIVASNPLNLAFVCLKLNVGKAPSTVSTGGLVACK